MNNKENAIKAMQGVTLTTDELKSIEGAGTLGTQLERLVGKSLFFSEVGEPRKWGEKDITVLTFEVEDDTISKTVSVAPMFDLGAFYLKNTYEVTEELNVSLRYLAKTTSISEVLENLAAFSIEDVVATNTFPLKSSIAAQELGIARDAPKDDINWDALKELYKSDPAKKLARTDGGNLSWLEIKHIIISPAA